MLPNLTHSKLTAEQVSKFLVKPKKARRAKQGHAGHPRWIAARTTNLWSPT